jgi:uncharacterized repeat protein (TIGR01451 family)
VTSINDAPIAGDDSAGPINQGGAVMVNVVANDTDPADPGGAVVPSSVLITSGPSAGIAVNNFDGTITYTHDGGPALTDTFTYTVDDNGSPPLTSNTATVTITINPPAVSVVKDVDPSSATLGETVTFTIYAWNDGLGTAYGMALTDCWAVPTSSARIHRASSAILARAGGGVCVRRAGGGYRWLRRHQHRHCHHAECADGH